MKHCLNLGIAWKGGGGSRLAQIAWSTFLNQQKDLCIRSAQIGKFGSGCNF